MSKKDKKKGDSNLFDYESESGIFTEEVSEEEYYSFSSFIRKNVEQ